MANRITPEDYAKSGSEHAHQAALFIWASLPSNKQKYPELDLLHAIPNGGARGKATAGRMKAEGVKAGIPDVFLPAPRPVPTPYPTTRWHHGLYIEMKKPEYRTRKNGGCSDAQLEVLAALQAQGYRVKVCYTWEEAATAIENYLERALE